MSLFKVGEVAIISCHGEYDGTEVVIRSLETVIEMYSWGAGKILREPAYEVSGIPLKYAFKRHLRKKRPPQETTTWQAVQSVTGWNPQGVPA